MVAENLHMTDHSTPPDGPVAAGNSDAGLKDYLRILSSCRWWLFALVGLCTALGAFYNFKLPNVYRAVTTIQINKDSPHVVDVKQVLETQSQANEFLKTQHKILGSRSMAERVIAKYALEEEPEFVGDPVDPLQIGQRRLMALFFGKPAEGGQKDLVGAYYKKVGITPVPFTLLVEVSVCLTNRQLAATLANAHAEAYLASTLEQRLGVTGEASEWLQTQSRELQAKLEKSEKAMQEYREKQGLVSLEEKQNIVVEKLRQLNEEATRCKNERISAENNFQQLKAMRAKGGDLTTLPFVMQNRMIQDFKTQKAEKATQVAKLRERYLEKHPALIQARSEEEIVDRQLKAEMEKVLVAVETDYQLAVSRERQMEQSLREQEQHAMALNEKQIGYESLKRQADADRQMYQAVLGRMKQTGVAKELDTTNISVVDRAVEPLGPYRPRRGLNIAICFMVSLVLGSVGCVLLETLTETVREPDDLRGPDLPFLGYIPRWRRPLLGRKNPLVGNDDVAAAEAFRTVLAMLSLQPQSADARVFLVTSATPGEGKTTCAMNLAARFAEKGFKTLLIEADLHHPNIGRAFELPAKGGLERVASSDIEGVVQESKIPNLRIVAVGKAVGNGSVLVSMPSVRQFLIESRQQFERVVIDTPPIGAVSDALNLCQCADAVVWVARFNLVRRAVVRDAIDRIRQVKGRLAGFVINDIDFRKHHNKYYYSYSKYDAYYRRK
ncbi:MAG: polysaccharide biosynthesis tyrosine autokinase [Verrucomicrobiae bacterium]|nr:polysaccharide biosynthesis tyrosine autokinase [Verrucomicrobiae bacterium]